MMASCVSVGSLHTKCRAHCRTRKESVHVVVYEQGELEDLPKLVCIQAGGLTLDKGAKISPTSQAGRV